MIYFDNSNNVNDNIDNLLNIISVILGYENLIENRRQSAENNINVSNQNQARLILNDLHRQFERQNKMLQEILILLKGDKINE